MNDLFDPDPCSYGDTLLIDRTGTTSYSWRPTGAQRLGKLSVEEFLNHVEQRLQCKLSINAVSRFVGLSRAVFTKRFRASIGISFHRYLVRRRIELAKRMLHGSESSLADISDATGFGSSAHFATVFRDIVGSTPARFREQSRARTNWSGVFDVPIRYLWSYEPHP